MAEHVTVTATDHQTGESDTLELPADNYVVVCGADRYVSHEQIYANGTTVVTIKALKELENDGS